MSNALAQNATDLAISSTPPDSYDFLLAVKRVADEKLPANGLTTFKVVMSRSKLISGVCRDYRGHYAALYDKRDEQGNKIPAERLPEDIYGKITSAVDEFIQGEFNKFISNPDQLVRSSSRFVHKSAQKDVVRRHTIIRDEVISLKEKRFGIELFIGETKRQIEKYNSQKTVLSEVTEDKLRKLEKRLAKEQDTLNHLDEEIAKQKTVTPPSNS